MSISIIIPVYNEEASLPILHEQISTALGEIGDAWEVIYVDDGSQDESLRVLEEIANVDRRHVRVLSFRRNFGQTTAISAGIDHSSGSTIVLMDADLQNDPADIPMMLNKLDEGYDLVSGWRVSRQDTFVTRTLPSKIANGLISWVTARQVHKVRLGILNDTIFANRYNNVL